MGDLKLPHVQLSKPPKHTSSFALCRPGMRSVSVLGGGLPPPSGVKKHSRMLTRGLEVFHQMWKVTRGSPKNIAAWRAKQVVKNLNRWFWCETHILVTQEKRQAGKWSLLTIQPSNRDSKWENMVCSLSFQLMVPHFSKGGKSCSSSKSKGCVSPPHP